MWSIHLNATRVSPSFVAKQLVQPKNLTETNASNETYSVAKQYSAAAMIEICAMLPRRLLQSLSPL
ncbi:hypothetical protein LOAG_08465 [Loa loa]|uniref:Short-chain dehydrogenase n=1 Tax=Loa loa TaxID=7209 RepID=A0A1I7VI49_LOALO|nr:hypothetical protein LOAG_08465 [Loa loa]EFO20027.1 hypothetical protein LOAG_08465 [Loa loa]